MGETIIISRKSPCKHCPFTGKYHGREMSPEQVAKLLEYDSHICHMSEDEGIELVECAGHKLAMNIINKQSSIEQIKKYQEQLTTSEIPITLKQETFKT